MFAMMTAVLLASSPVSLQFDGSLKDGLKQLAEKSGLNLVVIGEFDEKVQLNLPNVDGPEALETIALAYGLEVTRKGASSNLWVVRKAGGAIPKAPPVAPVLAVPPVPPVPPVAVATPNVNSDALRSAAETAREEAEEAREEAERIREKLPLVRRVSAYAMATNLLAKSPAELEELARLGLSLLYVGPESGDDVTLKRIAKGSTKQQHIEAAALARASGMQLSVIALLGIASERSQQHAEETADLVTQMDPAFFSALTVTVVPNTPLATLQAKGRFAVPPQDQLLRELATMIDLARPTSAVFRTNHASNYLPLAGRLPEDRAKLLSFCEQALQGRIRLRPEWARGL